MNDLIEYIDNTIKNCVTETRQFGLCHLLEADNGRYPATVERQAKKAMPDDRFLVTTYHRLLDGSTKEREDASFGKTPTIQNDQKVRMVVFTKLDGDDSRIDDIFNAIPSDFTYTGYAQINIVKNSISRNRQAIWSEEYEKAYIDKYQMVWQIYAIEYDLQYIKCNVCV